LVEFWTGEEGWSVVEEPDEFSQPGDLVASQFENEQAAWRYIQERYTMPGRR